jgi:hypothetical protein
MPFHKSAWLSVLGLILLGTAGCGGAPPGGARAIVPADHLEKQRLKLVQLKESLKAQPAAKHGSRR